MLLRSFLNPAEGGSGAGGGGGRCGVKNFSGAMYQRGLIKSDVTECLRMVTTSEAYVYSTRPPS